MMYAYNCSSDYIDNVEVLSYTNTSVTVKALAYTVSQVHIRFDYWWYEKDRGRHDTHTVNIDLNGNGGGQMTGEDYNPNNYVIDDGCWGTITLEVGKPTTVYCMYNILHEEKVKSILWSDYQQLGYLIITQNQNTCTIKGYCAYSGSKLYCLMKYGSATYKAYYIVNVKASTTETLSLTADPSGGNVSPGTKVYLTSSQSGSDIYYTTNGNNPTISSTIYTSSGITISESCTLKAFATKTGYNKSPVMTWIYVVDEDEASIAINETNFPDDSFRNYLLKQEYGKDWRISEDELKGVTSIEVSNINIKSLKGIELFPNLNSLDCSGNQLTTLDVSNNKLLTNLNCRSNQLEDLDVSENKLLTHLECWSNRLNKLDVSKNKALTYLHCEGNNLSSLDVSNNTELSSMSCIVNQIKELDVSNNTKLSSLYCHTNQITKLKLSHTGLLKILYCFKNRIIGPAMTAMINSLPNNNTEETFILSVLHSQDNSEENVCTRAQVAMAKAKGWTPYYYDGSESLEYEGVQQLELSASPHGGEIDKGTVIKLTTSSSGSTVYGADIYYTINGSAPTKSSTKYTSSGITINEACTLKAIAYKDGYETSDVLTEKYTIKSSTVEPTAITLPSSKTVKVGESFTMSYTLTPSNATTTLTWTSDDSSIATVSSSGVVKGVKEGNTKIRVKTANGKSDYCYVTVEDDSNDEPLEIVENNLAAGDNHSLIVKKDGTLWACGANYNGQLGDGTTTERYSPVKVMDDVANVSAGGDHSLILKKDGTLWRCGGNEKHSPIKFMDDVVSMSEGDYHSLILQKDGSVWAYGYNSKGALGDGTTSSKTTPVKVIDDASFVSAGFEYSLILKKDGTLLACGRNDEGELGDGTIEEKHLPVPIMSDVTSMSAGGGHTFILKKDGTLWGCGSNGSGQLGDGTTTDKLYPIKIMNNVASMSAGHGFSCILKKDGTLWTCGHNSDGRLGDGTTTEKHSPIQVMDNVASVSAGYFHTLILKKDGTLWVCGDNFFGQLGDGTTTNRYSPVKILNVNDIDGDAIENITPVITGYGDGPYYDLQGRRVAKPAKSGIYILNGKKVIIK